MEFEWDDGNRLKIQRRFVIEEIEDFFKQELIVFKDETHSVSEDRLIAVGSGPTSKPMFVCYTLRNDKIRVISARYMRHKEALRYEKFKKEN